MSKTKVLVVHMSLYNGGAERSLINFLNELSPERFEVDLLLFRTEGLFLPALPKHVRLLETPEPIRSFYHNANSVLPRAKGLLGLWYRALSAGATALAALGARGNANLRRQRRWRIYRRLIPPLPRTYDVAAAYLHGEISYYVMDKVSARRKLAWVHNDYDKTGQSPAIDRPYFEKFDRVASISALCVDKLRRAFPGLEEKFTEAPNLISQGAVRALSRAFCPEEFRKDAPCLLSVGRLSPQKASEMSVEAAAILKQRGVRFTWYLIGGGELRARVEALIEKHGLGNEVRLLGVKPNPYPYMAACDVYVQNSLYEGKSMVLDEAKILTKPIVVTNYPTVQDQIEADREGLVVPLTAQGVADGIQRMLADAALREGFTRYLAARDYGNTECIALYEALLTGE